MLLGEFAFPSPKIASSFHPLKPSAHRFSAEKLFAAIQEIKWLEFLKPVCKGMGTDWIFNNLDIIEWQIAKNPNEM